MHGVIGGDADGLKRECRATGGARCGGGGHQPGAEDRRAGAKRQRSAQKATARNGAFDNGIKLVLVRAGIPVLVKVVPGKIDEGLINHFSALLAVKLAGIRPLLHGPNRKGVLPLVMYHACDVGGRGTALSQSAAGFCAQ